MKDRTSTATLKIGGPPDLKLETWGIQIQERNDKIMQSQC